MELAAKSLTIQTAEDYKISGEYLVRLATWKKEWEAYWEPLWRRAKDVLDDIRNMRDNDTKWADEIRETLEKKMSDWRVQQEQTRAQIEERLLQNAAALKRQLILSGRLQEAEMVTAPLLPDSHIKLDNISSGTEYDVHVTSLMDFIKGVADGTIPLFVQVQGKPTPVLDIRHSTVKSARKSMGEAFNWPGVKVTIRKAFRVKAES